MDRPLLHREGHAPFPGTPSKCSAKSGLGSRKYALSSQTTSSVEAIKHPRVSGGRLGSDRGQEDHSLELGGHLLPPSHTASDHFLGQDHSPSSAPNSGGVEHAETSATTYAAAHVLPAATSSQPRTVAPKDAAIRPSPRHGFPNSTVPTSGPEALPSCYRGFLFKEEKHIQWRKLRKEMQSVKRRGWGDTLLRKIDD